MSISNKDYLNELIAKAEKSWGGVGVDCDMSDLRDDLTDKEDAEKKQKAIENLKKAMKDAYNKTMEEQIWNLRYRRNSR